MGFRIRNRDLLYDPHPSYSITLTAVEDTLAAQRQVGSDLYDNINKVVDPDGKAAAYVWDHLRVKLFRSLSMPFRQGVKDALR